MIDDNVLLRGPITIVDDDDDIREKIKKWYKNIELVHDMRIPEIKEIEIVKNSNLVILDWEYRNVADDLPNPTSPLPERVTLKTKIEFIEAIINNFTPIIIYTNQLIIDVKDEINLHITTNDRNRIGYILKTDVNSQMDFESEVIKIFRDNPSLYAIKHWQVALSKSIKDRYLEFEKINENWVSRLWEIFANDSRVNKSKGDHDADYLFNEFLMKNIKNSIHMPLLPDEVMFKECHVDVKDLLEIIQSDSYIKYTEEPKRIYSGDLFKSRKDDSYLINIRAQCDLSRMERDKVDMYLLEIQKDDSVNSDHIKFDTSENITIGNTSFVIQKSNILEINKKITKFLVNARFNNGAFIGNKVSEITIPFIDGNKAVKVMLKKFQVSKYPKLIEDKYERIGRIVDPLFTEIRNKFAGFAFREGMFNIPLEFFEEII